jgi:hypothetical protein
VVEVYCTDEFTEWFKALGDDEAKAVLHVVDLLELMGLALGTPHSSALKATRYALRELRPKQGHSPLRVVYAFDPKRDAVVIIGGDKSGDPKFYERIIEQAERLWERYLAERAAAETEGEG